MKKRKLVFAGILAVFLLAPIPASGAAAEIVEEKEGDFSVEKPAEESFLGEDVISEDTQPDEKNGFMTENDLRTSDAENNVEVVSEGICGENVTWRLDSKGTLTLSGTGPTTDYRRWSEVPWYWKNVRRVTVEAGITSIGDYFFDSQDFIKEIILPESITRIGRSAYESCDGLEKVYLPDSIAEIGERAFESCDSLESFEFPLGFTEVPGSVLANCEQLRQVVLPESITSIKSKAFYKCENLINIVLPESLLEIEEDAFFSCTNLDKIWIPSAVQAIGEDAFAGCCSLTEIQVSEDNETYASIDGALFDKECTMLLVVPSGMEGIYSVPEGVIYIKGAFSDCGKITRVNIPASVQEIDISAVRRADYIWVSEENPYYSSWDGTLLNKEMTKFLVCPMSRRGIFELPASVKIIGDRAFLDTSLEEVQIPNEVTDIGDGSFMGSSIVRVHIPASVQHIEQGAFFSCTSLKKIVFYGKNPIIDDPYNEEVFFWVNADVYYNEDIWGVPDKHWQGGALTWHDCVPSPSEINQVGEIGYQSLEIHWNPVKNAEGYRLYYQEDGGAWKFAAQIEGRDNTSYVHTGLKSGRDYIYYVRAYSTLDDGEKLFGAYSDGKSGRAKNSRSEIEKIQSWGYSALKINWKPVQDAEGYRIYCKEPGKSWKYVTQVANGETVSYIHTGRITGRNYTYYIRAYRTLDGKKVFGAYSDGKSGKAVPKQVKITKAKAQKGKAVLAWNKVNGASGYRIYYKNSENGKWHYVTQIGKGSTTAYTHKGIKSGKEYYYTMRAYRTVNGKKVFGAYAGWKQLR